VVGAELFEAQPERHHEIERLPNDHVRRWHDANPRWRPGVGGEREAEHVGPRGEAAPPELVAEHDDRVGAAKVLLRGINATERGLDAQRPERVSRNRASTALERVAVAPQRQAGWFDHAEVVQGAASLAPGNEVRRSDNIPDGAAARSLPHRDNALTAVVQPR